MHRLKLLHAVTLADSKARRRRRCRDRNRLDVVNLMSDQEFVQHFRLDKPTFHSLVEELKNNTSLRGTTEHPLELKVLCTLSFLATGSYQRIVGVSQHLVQRTVSRFIRQVIKALSSEAMLEKWIAFPTTLAERNVTKANFQQKFNLPGIIGCIDGTHIAIVRPKKDDYGYFNRKGFHSLNVQMVCDDKLKITHVNAKFGGAAHDSHVWSSSDLKLYMEELHRNGEQVWLLGDSGYAQRPWLMTPILNAADGSREATYTRRHVRARNCVERCFGVLKSRWRCLLKHRVLHYDPDTAAWIIQACVVLHNMAQNAAMPLPTEQDIAEAIDDHLGMDSPAVLPDNDNIQQGRAMLNHLLRRMH